MANDSVKMEEEKDLSTNTVDTFDSSAPISEQLDKMSFYGAVEDIPLSAETEHRLEYLRKRNRRVVGGLGAVLIVVVLISASMVYLSSSPDNGKLIVDGNLEDWHDVIVFSDLPGDMELGNVNIKTYAAALEDGDLLLQCSVGKNLFIGTGYGLDRPDEYWGEDVLMVLFDLDSDPRTGYNIMGMGADARLEVYASNLTVSNISWTRFTEGANSSDWNGWEGRHLPDGFQHTFTDVNWEARLPSGMFWEDGSSFDGASVDVLFNIRDSEGNMDWGDGIYNLLEPSCLVVSQEPTQTGDELLFFDPALKSHQSLLNVTLTAYGDKPVTVSRVEFADMFNNREIDPVKGIVNLELEAGESRTVTVGIGEDNKLPPPPTAVHFGIPSVDEIKCDASRVQLLGKGVDLYYKFLPDQTIIPDGASGDWEDFSASLPKSDSDQSPSLTLESWGLRSDGESLLMYIKTEGRVLEGDAFSAEPVFRHKKVDFQPGRDSDLDGVPDDMDGAPWDYDNDGMTDDDDPDDDNDGQIDSVDRDLGINNDGVHIFRAREDREVEAEPEYTHQERLSAHRVSFMINWDGSSLSGYSPPGSLLGADVMINITGRDGSLWESRVFVFGGMPQREWNWEPVGTVDCMLGYSTLEVMLTPSIVGIDDPLPVDVNGAVFLSNMDYSKFSTSLKNTLLDEKATWIRAPNGTSFMEVMGPCDYLGLLGDLSDYQSNNTSETWDNLTFTNGELWNGTGLNMSYSDQLGSYPHNDAYFSSDHANRTGYHEIYVDYTLNVSIGHKPGRRVEGLFFQVDSMSMVVGGNGMPAGASSVPGQIKVHVKDGDGGGKVVSVMKETNVTRGIFTTFKSSDMSSKLPNIIRTLEEYGGCEIVVRVYLINQGYSDPNIVRAWTSQVYADNVGVEISTC